MTCKEQRTISPIAYTANMTVIMNGLLDRPQSTLFALLRSRVRRAFAESPGGHRSGHEQQLVVDVPFLQQPVRFSRRRHR
jgi:hypothetical protein